MDKSSAGKQRCEITLKSVSSTVRLLYDATSRPRAFLRASFPPCFPRLLALYIFSDCVSCSAATSRIRKNDVPDDATPGSWDSILIASYSSPTLRFQPVVEKVTRFHLAEAAGTRVFHRRPARILFQFSRLTSRSRRSETRVKRGVT